MRLPINFQLRRPPAVLLPLLIPISLLYGVLASIHRALYGAGILRRRKLPRPVVSVGNLTVGGGGKTPLVMWLAHALRERGVRTAILSRGYGRRGANPRLVNSREPWELAGDEPFLMASRLVDIPVAVATDRYEAGREVLRHHDVDLFILDDGFQHRRLERDLDIVVVDHAGRFGNGRLLPAGTLREPPSRLALADIVVVTRAPGRDEVLEGVLRNLTTAPITWTDYGSGRLLPLPGNGDRHEEQESPGPFLAFCGIANPGGFKRTLERGGFDLLDTMVFPDHHPYSGGDIHRIVERSRSLGAKALVTTEKDAVRLPAPTGSVPCFALAVEVELHGNPEAILEPVLALVGSTSGKPLS
ncbi:MAG: tetraacyldisaccharide 4'-kinase [bacterium]|nr:tetraacyldisaccharide 4'-kinase [bacterium]